MVEIRSCAGMEELDACVRLEIDTWGYDETEVVPRKTFLLAQNIGGQVIGAFERPDGDHEPTLDRRGALIGFAMSLPGIKEVRGQAQPYLHSHMLAVRPGERNRGIGAQLKWAQRHEALARGIRHMEWTFDPLEIKNAFLNIHRLGALCRSYRENFYGVSSSRLQAGLPTDRLVAEWKLDSPRVQQAEDGQPAVPQAIEERIVVPVFIEQWKASATDRERALAVLVGNRRKFQQAFASGLTVLGFTRDAEGNGVFELGRLTD
ncbi:MAG: GNAT family N-acetyltransferase [Acidobacteriota bacterium]